MPRDSQEPSMNKTKIIVANKVGLILRISISPSSWSSLMGVHSTFTKGNIYGGHPKLSTHELAHLVSIWWPTHVKGRYLSRLCVGPHTLSTCVIQHLTDKDLTIFFPSCWTHVDQAIFSPTYLTYFECGNRPCGSNPTTHTNLPILPMWFTNCFLRSPHTN